MLSLCVVFIFTGFYVLQGNARQEGKNVDARVVSHNSSIVHEDVFMNTNHFGFFDGI